MWVVLYVVGAMLLLLVQALLPKPLNGHVIVLGGLCLAAGFCVRAWPVVRHVWGRPWGKILFTVANVAVAVVAHVLALKSVATALELPPEMFGETVTLVSLVLIVPVWLILASVVLAPLTIGLFFWGMVTESGRGFRSNAGLSIIGHASGAIALLFFFAHVIDIPLSWPSQRAGWIQTVAYEVDFHPMRRFPGVPAEARAKVLENGWLAVAVVRDGQLEFDIVPALSAD